MIPHSGPAAPELSNAAGESNPAVPPAAEPKPTKRKLIWFGLVVLGIVIVIIVAALLLLGRGQSLLTPANIVASPSNLPQPVGIQGPTITLAPVPVITAAANSLVVTFNVQNNQPVLKKISRRGSPGNISFYLPGDRQDFYTLKVLDVADIQLFKENFAPPRGSVGDSLTQSGGFVPLTNVDFDLTLPFQAGQRPAKVQLLNSRGQQLGEQVFNWESLTITNASAVPALKASWWKKVFGIQEARADGRAERKFIIGVMSDAGVSREQLDALTLDLAAMMAKTKPWTMLEQKSPDGDPWHMLTYVQFVKMPSQVNLGCSNVGGYVACNMGLVNDIGYQYMPNWSLILVASNVAGATASVPTNSQGNYVPMIFAASGANAALISHSMGHAIGGLADEYGNDGGSPVQAPNCFSSQDSCQRVTAGFLGAKCSLGCNRANTWRPSDGIMAGNYDAGSYGPYEDSIMQNVVEHIIYDPVYNFWVGIDYERGNNPAFSISDVGYANYVISNLDSLTIGNQYVIVRLLTDSGKIVAETRYSVPTDVMIDGPERSAARIPLATNRGHVIFNLGPDSEATQAQLLSASGELLDSEKNIGKTGDMIVAARAGRVAALMDENPGSSPSPTPERDPKYAAPFRIVVSRTGSNVVEEPKISDDEVFAWADKLDAHLKNLDPWTKIKPAVGPAVFPHATTCSTVYSGGQSYPYCLDAGLDSFFPAAASQTQVHVILSDSPINAGTVTWGGGAFSPIITIGKNVTDPALVAHLIGHAFGQLTDEYSMAAVDAPAGFNCFASQAACDAAVKPFAGAACSAGCNSKSAFRPSAGLMANYSAAQYGPLEACIIEQRAARFLGIQPECVAEVMPLPSVVVSPKVSVSASAAASPMFSPSVSPSPSPYVTPSSSAELSNLSVTVSLTDANRYALTEAKRTASPANIYLFTPPVGARYQIIQVFDKDNKKLFENPFYSEALAVTDNGAQGGVFHAESETAIMTVPAGIPSIVKLVADDGQTVLSERTVGE